MTTPTKYISNAERLVLLAATNILLAKQYSTYQKIIMHKIESSVQFSWKDCNLLVVGTFPVFWLRAQKRATP